MGEPLTEFGCAYLIDRTVRATAGRFEIILDPAIAEESLGRAPDVAANGILSWGGVSADQILELLDLCGDDLDRQVWSELLAEHAARDLFISLLWRTGEALHGE